MDRCYGSNPPIATNLNLTTMKKILFFSVIILSSCSTYRRSEIIGEFFDNKGNEYQIWKTEIFDRKTKMLLDTKVDTLKHDPFFVGQENL
jgi:hypothetical protein